MQIESPRENGAIETTDSTPIEATATVTDTTQSTSCDSNLNTSNNTSGSPIKVPGTYSPQWLPDHETDSCMSCSNLFTIIKRRHHCRGCGKIFCGDCCRQKARLLYLDNKEARVCNSCFALIEYTFSKQETSVNSNTSNNLEQGPIPSSSSRTHPSSSSSLNTKVQGVLKTSNQSRTSNECNTSSSSLDTQQQQSNKQVIFADGIRPGTDLTESYSYPVPSSSSSDSTTSASFSLLSRQNRTIDLSNETTGNSNKKNKNNKSNQSSHKNITVCDELGYLPPIIIHDDELNSLQQTTTNNNSSSSITNLIVSQFKSNKKSIQASMESRSCPLNGVIKFEEISSLVGIDGVVTFLLLKDFYLKIKLIDKLCCLDKKNSTFNSNDTDEDGDKSTKENNDLEILHQKQQVELKKIPLDQDDEIPRYWCFTSDGLSRFGQSEIVLVINKDKEDSCIPRDVFKIYLTLHELALRRQSLENLGNLLFQDGLFENRDTAGLIFARLLETHCVKNLVLPDKPFLFAIILQRWEVPWSKVFPMRLLLRLGYKFDVYPYPIVSFKIREPVYYEVGHTIISILGDFRNFRYSITHVDGLKVMINKKTKQVSVKLDQSCYQQFNKVLDSSNNEHVLAWSSCPFPEADGHLVSLQNEDGQHETVEFYKKKLNNNVSFDSLESGPILGASFVIFSGALKVNQSGQSAKISIVEDGLLIQIQSCTMSALRNAIHFMHHFDINCENNQDPLNKVEIDWQLENT